MLSRRAPAGDLGVQRGVLQWFVSLHSPAHPVAIRQDKMEDPEGDSQVTLGSAAEGSQEVQGATPGETSIPRAPASASASASTSPEKEGSGEAAGAGLPLPVAFTPSINKTLNMLGDPDAAETMIQVPPLPEGLTVAQMKTRLNGKAKIK